MMASSESQALANKCTITHTTDGQSVAA